jgi:hypothetical protein
MARIMQYKTEQIMHNVLVLVMLTCAEKNKENMCEHKILLKSKKKIKFLKIYRVLITSSNFQKYVSGIKNC